MKNTNLIQYLAETQPTDHMRDSILKYYNKQVGYEGIRFNPLFNQFECNTSMIEDQLNCTEANELYLVTQVLRYTSYVLDFQPSKDEMIYWFGRYSKTTLTVIVDFEKGLVLFKSPKLKTKVNFNKLNKVCDMLETHNICLHKYNTK